MERLKIPSLRSKMSRSVSHQSSECRPVLSFRWTAGEQHRWLRCWRKPALGRTELSLNGNLQGETGRGKCGMQKEWSLSIRSGLKVGSARRSVLADQTFSYSTIAFPSVGMWWLHSERCDVMAWRNNITACSPRKWEGLFWCKHGNSLFVLVHCFSSCVASCMQHQQCLCHGGGNKLVSVIYWSWDGE